MPPKANWRSRTPPCRGYWDRHRERKAKERELAEQKAEKEREEREQDAMYLEDPHTLDWWARTRETSAMSSHDDWHLLFPCFKNMSEW